MSGSKRARRRKRASSSKRRNSVAPDVAPRPVRLILESHERLGKYLEASSDAETAAALALQDLREQVGEIVRLMAGHDSLDIAEAIAFSNLASDPETYKETEHEGSAAVIEIVALVSGSRSVAPSEGLPGNYDIRNQPKIDQVQEAAVAASHAASVWRLFTAVQDEHSAAGFSLQLAIRESTMRGTSYPHMLRDTVNEILGDPDDDRAFHAATGFGFADILAVLDGLAKHRENGWNSRLESLSLFESKAREWTIENGAANLSDFAEAAFAATWANPSSVSVIDSDKLAAAIGRTGETVEEVLNFFTCDVSDLDAVQVVERFFSGDNPLRARPFIRHPSGRRFLVNEALLLPAILERVEATLKASGGFNEYSQHRGELVEAAALRLLQSIFPSGVITASFKYFVPDPAKADESDPENYTKLVEGDGLLVVDDVAIVVEVKAGALSDAARTGNAARLRRDLSSLLSDGAAQASRTRRRIVDDQMLRLRDGSVLDLSGVREVHSIVVTLEDLAGIATITDDLVSANLLPKDHLPLTISLHDLRVISELVERPPEFLLYLRRRTLPEITRRYLAPDELDFYMHMLRRGLYVEPDPDLLALEIPYFAATTADRRRFKAQKPEFLTSRTVPLDDWYFYQLGERTTPAPKPRLNADPGLLRLVDAIVHAGELGWLSTSTTLLSGDADVQKHWAEYGTKLGSASKRDGMPHSMTVVVGDRAQSVTVLGWLNYPALTAETSAELDEHFGSYLAAKKHQLALTRGALLVFHEGHFSHVLFDNRIPAEDPDLDADVVRFGLVEPQKMNASEAAYKLRNM